MSLFTKALREESETIRFDNLFTADIEKEQEFDLIFAAEQDDEDLKTIAGNAIMKEDGSEIDFNLPDCVTVNEDGEVVDKDEEEEAGEDVSSNDVNDNGMDDDLEAAAEEKPASGPSVVVNVDADDVNINAADDKTAFGEDGDVTVNAQVANITPAPAASEPVTPAAEPVPTTAPEAPTAPAESEESKEDEDLTPIEDEEDKEVEVKVEVEPDQSVEVEVEPPAEEPAVEPVPTEDEPSTDTSTDEPEEDDGVSEGAELDLITPDQLEDIVTTETSPYNTPVDPSTEVVFSDNPDMEVKDDGVNEMTLIEEDLGDPTMGDAPQKDSEIEEVDEPTHTDTSAYSALEKEDPSEIDDAMETIDDLEIDGLDEGFEDEEVKSEELGKIDLEGMAPSITSGDIEGIFTAADDDPSKKTNGTVNDKKVEVSSEMTLIEEDEGFDDESKGTEDTAELSGEDTPENEGCCKEEVDNTAVKDDENLEPAGAEEFSDDLEPIVDGDVEKIMNDAPEDEVKEELKIDPVEPADIPMNTSVKEEVDNTAVKDDDNLEPAGAEDFSDDLEPITDGDVEKIMNNAPEDEVKEELGIDPVEPSDIPMNTSVKEDSAEIIDSKDIAENDPLSPIGPDEIIPDEVNAPEEDVEYDKVAAERLKEDYEDDVAAISTGDDFADVENDGLDHSPEDEEPGSMEELIDDEAAAFVESEI